MIYRIDHRITYTYSATVFLEPHIVRLRPRCDICQAVSRFAIDVAPLPVDIHHYLDAEGNSAACLWFEKTTGTLAIATSFEVQTLCPNPFGYLVTDQAFLQLPVRYPAGEKVSLDPFRNPAEPDETIQALGRSVLAGTKGGTLNFLSRLCTVMYENFTVEVRDEGPSLSPAETIRHKKGACRDLTLLFMEVCRSVGLAARFVSGYQEGDQEMENRHLHAWAEVYIPGGGWRGYDPTLGLAVADRHIPLAASRKPAGAAPVTGTFRGTDVTAQMEYRISLQTITR